MVAYLRTIRDFKELVKMKYIRTKDGIYEINKLIYAFNDNEEYLIKDIVKEADTIEEVCDAFVWEKYPWAEVIEVFPDNPWDKTTPKERNLKYARERAKAGKTIYGAIWTDKGLIYVAKMNEKGELELL